MAHAIHPSDGYITMPDGVRLFYRKTGSGPQVLLPNGFHLFDDFQRFAARRTLIFYDVRNRGQSDSVTDPSKLANGILQDADDLDAVRRHFEITRLDAIAHSYIGVMLGLYAKKYPSHLSRMILLGPMQPNAATQYPAHLTNADSTLAEVLSRLAELQKQRSSPDQDPREACEKFWSALRPIYVANPVDAGKIKWSRCDLPNERNFMKYWIGSILPSIQRLHFSPADLANAKAPVLIVHGVKDRSSPYGGGRDWALLFPNARLLTVENAAHAPWIEAPDLVFSSIQTFLDGHWPDAARTITSLDPRDEPARING
ncbi:MAG: alpha/beta hydrolase [Acidobacteriia bacterium]|nr:alpha/beta hydrolase [Terriglobia bacterium]